MAQALTDIDLFSSYGLTQKAIDLLEVVLQRVPGHAPTLERLLDHHLGAGDEKRTAELAAQLEQIHIDGGNTTAAERFGDLRRRFGHTSQATIKTSPPSPPPQPAVPEFPVAANAPETEQQESVAPSEEAQTEAPAQTTIRASSHRCRRT